MNEETDEAKWSPDEGVGIKILELCHTCAFKNMFTWGGDNLLKIQFNTIYTIRGSRWLRFARLNFLEDHSYFFLLLSEKNLHPSSASRPNSLMPCLSTDQIFANSF